MRISYHSLCICHVLGNVVSSFYMYKTPLKYVLFYICMTAKKQKSYFNSLIKWGIYFSHEIKSPVASTLRGLRGPMMLSRTQVPSLGLSSSCLQRGCSTSCTTSTFSERQKSKVQVTKMKQVNASECTSSNKLSQKLQLALPLQLIVQNRVACWHLAAREFGNPGVFKQEERKEGWILAR